MEPDLYRDTAEAETRHWWAGSTRALLRQTMLPHLSPGGRYLDVGAGTGATGAWMADHGSLIASDIEFLALELFRERHAETPLTLADARRLPFGDASFDATLCVTVLYHQAIESPAEVVGELARVTKPGGIVVLLEPGGRRLMRAHDRMGHGARRFSRGDLRALLEANRLDVVKATGVYSFLVPPAAVKAVVERGKAASDLAKHQDGLRGLLPALASLERKILGRADLPFGLSVYAIGRKR
ncbi:MAG: class I SAM-dependent methyltransferase [Acidimicrobiia bacterium]